MSYLVASIADNLKLTPKLMSENANENERCPFWSTYALKCRLCNEGLFIPLDDHIEVYCTTPEYPLCLQYNMNSEGRAMIKSKTQRPEENRRAFPRLERSFKVTLVKMTESGKLAKHFSLHASTLDISRGGMRLNTTERLIDDTQIAFSFVDVFPEELQSGTATIKWCRQQEESGFYEAGLAFENPRSEAAGMYLKLTVPEN
jgi:hypothetical protein